MKLLRRVCLIATIGASSGLAGDAAPRSSFEQTHAPATVLSEGLRIQRAATTGESHRYEAWLSAGDFLEISASQDHFRISVAVKGPDDQILYRLDIPEIDVLPDRLLFVSTSPGRYAIQVSVGGAQPVTFGRERDQPSAAAGSGGYSLQVLAMRPATPQDLSRARWFGVLERAIELAKLRSIRGLQEAIPVYIEAADGWRSLGDVPLEATTLEGLANLTSFFVQFAREAIAARERLVHLYSRMGDRSLEHANWRRLAGEYGKLGRFGDAKAAADRALKLGEALGLRISTAATRRQLGMYEFELGNFARAGELAREAYDFAVSIRHSPLQARALYDLARLDALAGDLEAALTRNTEALTLASGDATATASMLMAIGFNHLARGEFDAAASRLEERLAFGRTIVHRDQEAFTRLGLADVARARGDREDARQRYSAVAAALEAGLQQYRCIAEDRLARMHLEDGRLDDAGAGFERMMQIATGRYHQCEAQAHAGLADVAARRGDLDIADREARRVVELTEAFREAAVSFESRSLGFGALAPAYERAIDISMRRAERGDPDAAARAFVLNEQALARGLLDRLLEARLDANARVPSAMAAERAMAREKWRARLAELDVALRTRPEAQETAALAADASRLAVRVRDLDAQIDAADARQATFIRPRPLTVAAAQALLDDDTVLLEYALGDARSYLFVLSHAEMRTFTLPRRAEIEGIARRVHEQLARPPDGMSTGQTDGSGDRRQLTRLLLEPAASWLTGKRLVVVLPGALSLIPFGALPEPGNAAAPPPMSAGHEIVQVPSATTLAAIRTLTNGRPRALRTAAIFADPIFDARDPRVRRSSSSTAPTSSPPAVRRSGRTLGRLPFSRAEAEAIASLAPGRVDTFLGSNATRDRALDRALFNYRFIHFATHGIVNQDVPSLSSLVLSLVDSTGEGRDGLVMLPDIYDMTLNADLVVLSGCQTALGRQVRGEGPIGLARAFMYAGVPRVVASLWLVDDLATAELMKRFYRGILVDGKTPAAALRAAQRALAADPRWNSPYFWAPFVLQGDWR